MKRRTVVAYVAAIAGLALAGCSSDANDAASDTPAAERAAVDADEHAEDSGAAQDAGGPDGVIAQVQAQALDRDIIYTVDLDIVTLDVDDAARRTASIALAAGGFVADETTGASRATITLRVPVADHQETVAELEDLGDVTDRRRSTEDVTQDVVDTESRIASQRESIARIRALLDEADDLSDVISIESELARREADLDALLTRQERLSDLTSMATVTATFHAATEETDEPAAPAGFTGGLASGWNAFTEVMGIALTVLGAVLPFLIVGAPVGLAVWVWTTRRRRPQPSA